MSLFSSFNSSYSETQSTEERRDNSTSCEQSIDDRRLDLRKNIRPPVTPLKHKLEVVKQNDDEFVSFDTERIIDTVPPAESFRRNSLTKTPSKRAISPDSKSRDDILYLAKSFRSRSVILPNKATTASSSSGYNSSGKITYDYDYRTVHAPVKLPCARQLKVETQGSGKESSNFFSANGKYYTNIITVDSRDGKGYGRRIRIAPNINKEIFLNCRQGVVISLKMKKLESFRLLRKEKSVGKLIEKFRYLSPQDPISMHYFGFEKMYCISDIVLQEYNPNPSLKSPYVNKNAQFAFENDGKFERIEGVRKKQTNLSYQPNQPKQTVSFHSSVTTSNSFAASFPASVSVSELKKEHENTERDQSFNSPSAQRRGSVKQIAREKRFLTELFLPLLNEKLKPEILDFIKEEVTMQLNLKICDLYEDDELSITDKETFEKALGSYLRSEKLVKLLQESRDSLLSFVKENMP